MADERFRVADMPLVGLKLIERRRIGDDRGFLQRLYCRDALAGAGFTRDIAQINHTSTRRQGVVRGMHFQHPPHAEDKFVSVLRGEVFDVAVDLRQGSSTFLHWHGERLSAANGRSLFIPVGFAHGFQTLTEDCELLYLHTASYLGAAEDAVHALDPAIGVEWPLAITEMSQRDRSHSSVNADFAGIIP